MSQKVLMWVVFNVLVLALLCVDLGVIHRKTRSVSIREAVIWSVIWTVVALLFNLGVYFYSGLKPAVEFLTCYMIERSLSIDNMFVFLVIFSYFSIKPEYQYKVLFWGIIGAMVTRIVFILAGITLVSRFHWILYIFGLFLVVTGVRLALGKDKKVSPDKNPLLVFVSRLFPVAKDYEGDRFVIKRDGRYIITPLLLVLLVIDAADIVFSMDSIPAIFGITLNTFIVYTSNVSAILGLRALYFVLSGVTQIFKYVNYGLSVILVFIGAKMLVADIYEIKVGIALGIVSAILAVSIIFSVFDKKEHTGEASVK